MAFSIRAATPTDLDAIGAIDDDASELFAQAGLHLLLPDDHPYTVTERARWRRCVEHGDTFLAVDDALVPVGFAALELLDGAPYLEQLSVRRSAMRQGLGRKLLAQAVAWARPRGEALWLTTYGHLPWNRPFYEKDGFVVMPPTAWGAELSARTAEERQVLPAPEQRIVMCRALPRPRS